MKGKALDEEKIYRLYRQSQMIMAVQAIGLLLISIVIFRLTLSR